MKYIIDWISNFIFGKYTEETVLTKNGRGYIQYVWLMDYSKPKCYRDGNSYKFNSCLLSREDIK